MLIFCHKKLKGLLVLFIIIDNITEILLKVVVKHHNPNPSLFQTLGHCDERTCKTVKKMNIDDKSPKPKKKKKNLIQKPQQLKDVFTGKKCMPPSPFC